MPASTLTKTKQPQSSPAEGRWAELIRLAGDEAGHAQLVESLLRAWCAERRATGAALYLKDDSNLRCLRKVGEGGFPVTLCDGAPADGMASRALPGGLLVWQPADGEAGAAGDPDEDPLLVAASLASRIAVQQRQLKRQHFAASYRGVEQQALYDVGLAITSTLELDGVSDSILTWALGLLDARTAALYLRQNDDQELRLVRVLGGEARPTLPLAELERLPDDLLPEASHRLAAIIQAEGQPRGLLVVADKESRRGVGPFGEADRRTLDLFANQAAIALENARLHRQALEKERLEREMELAADIQRQILPVEMPEIPGFDVLGWNRPARHVGGDYFDLLPLDEDRLILTLGDVSGKGMPAALMVSILHSALRLMLDRHEFGPGLIERLNRHIYDSSAPNKFITLFSAVLHRQEGRLRYVNAGHNPGVVIDRGGQVREMPSSGLPVGMMPGAHYQAETVDLLPGELVCIYSDGITECADPAGEEFDLPRLVELLAEHREAPLPDIIEAIDRATTDFCEGQPQGDDQTVILLRRTAE